MEELSWFLVVYGLVGVWITGTHNWGWLMAVSFQIAWTYYALSIDAHALAFQSVAFGFIAIRNYRVGRTRRAVSK